MEGSDYCTSCTNCCTYGTSGVVVGSIVCSAPARSWFVSAHTWATSASRSVVACCSCSRKELCHSKLHLNVQGSSAFYQLTNF